MVQKILIAVAMLAAGAIGWRYGRPPWSRKPVEPSLPTTVRDVVDDIIKTMPESSRLYILNNHDISWFSGMAIRNNYGLWNPESPIRKNAAETYKIAHPDDISGLILAWVVAIVKDQPFDAAEHCNMYHDHWARDGQTSLQAGGYDT
jgi:hypothetical protein